MERAQFRPRILGSGSADAGYAAVQTVFAVRRAPGGVERNVNSTASSTTAPPTGPSQVRCVPASQHPQVGRLMLEHLVLRLPDAPGLGIVVYTALPDWETPAKLAKLMKQPSGEPPLPFPAD